jgi:hypothetical protein
MVDSKGGFALKSVVSLGLVLILVALFSAGCASMTPQQQQMLSGGAIGGAAGAVLAAIGGSPVVGAAVGTAVGVAAGALWEDIQHSLGLTRRPLPPMNPPPPQ